MFRGSMQFPDRDMRLSTGTLLGRNDARFRFLVRLCRTMNRSESTLVISTERLADCERSSRCSGARLNLPFEDASARTTLVTSWTRHVLK